MQPNDRAAVIVVGPLGFERGPHGDGIANSANFYAASFPFLVTIYLYIDYWGYA